MSAPASRRALLCGIAALPAIGGAAFASPTATIGSEAAFLARAPLFLPNLREMLPQKALANRLYRESEAAAGEHPGWDVPGEAHAWFERACSVRDGNGYHEAWNRWNAAAARVNDIVEPFEDVPMQSLQAILLKSLLGDVSDFWADSAADDLRRMAERQLCA